MQYNDHHQVMPNQIYRMKILFATFLSLLLAGCTFFTKPLERPVIEQKTHKFLDVEKVSIFSSTASRRHTIVHMPELDMEVLEHLTKEEQAKLQLTMVCSEPPSDVAEMIISNLKFLIENSKQGKVGFAESISTNVDRLLHRTQGIQFFRDSVFHLCLARLNGVFDDDMYEQQFQELVKISRKLIQSELSLKSPIPIELKHAIELTSQAESLKSDAMKLEDEVNKIPVSSNNQQDEKIVNDAKEKVEVAVKHAEQTAIKLNEIIKNVQNIIALNQSKIATEKLSMQILENMRQFLKTSNNKVIEANEAYKKAKDTLSSAQKTDQKKSLTSDKNDLESGEGKLTDLK